MLSVDQCRSPSLRRLDPHLASSTPHRRYRCWGKEEGAPCWGRRVERRCRCHWGRREESRSLHACALPYLRMPLSMGKKRGVPWSARSRAAAPPSAIADVGEEGRSAAADVVGEEERSIAVSTPMCRCTTDCCRWGRRGECSSCLVADRRYRWRTVMSASPPSLSRSNGERQS
jgi:hypothetical protein